MIIKSLSRKAPSFGQLVDYVHAAKDAELALVHNFKAGALSQNSIIHQLEKNYHCLPRRINGNALYHEIIALEPELALSRKAQIAALKDIARHYVNKRAPHQLAYGVIHTDTPHLHMHLIISSNGLESKKREWLSKKEFATLQQETEAYKIMTHPELGQARYYSGEQKRERRKVQTREQASSLRTGKPSKKAELATNIKTIFTRTRTQAELEAALQEQGLTLYTRGKSAGIMTAGGRRYRFTTLGLGREYAETMIRFDIIAERTATRERYWQAKEQAQALEQDDEMEL